MRQEVKEKVLLNFFSEFSKSFKNPCKVYILGGASALLYRWRESTNDIDLKVLPDSEAYQIISSVKNNLNINIELASPDNFIPELPDWQNRSLFIGRYGQVEYYHYDFYSQALSKIERGFERDILDVQAMFRLLLIEKDKLLQFFNEIEPKLIKFPAIDSKTFRKRIEDFISKI